MAFSYSTDTANDIPDWFSSFETFLAAIGWTVVSGSGTTTLVISSPGEQGGLTKLYAQFRRGTGADSEKVYHRVQDDAVPTHATTEWSISAPGDGSVPFVYFMNGDKDMISVSFKSGPSYNNCYVGLTEAFAQNVTDETTLMVSITPTITGPWVGYNLHKHDDTWNATCFRYQHDTWEKDPLDDSVALFGGIVSASQFPTLGDEIIGQLKNVGGLIADVPALNPEDTLTTGLAGATSTWIILGAGANRFAMRTGGTLPLGTADGAHFAHQSQLASSFNDLFTRLKAFTESVGWTVTGNPVDQDLLFNCAGEDGLDDIWIRIYYDGIRSLIFRVQDDAGGTHSVSAGYVGGVEGPLVPGNFPTYYYVTADRNCLYFTLDKNGVYQTVWAGMFKMFNPDPGSIATPYKVGGCMTPAGDRNILRDHSGNWDRTLSEMSTTDYIYGDSSPNKYGDGQTYTVWAKALSESGGVPIGVCPYTYYLSGTIAVLDTVTVGAQVFKYFTNNIAMRIA